jgi:hypothetical protein
MATEEFKLLTEELFDNYVELHKKINQQGYEVKLSFKEYLDFYIEYTKNDEDYSDLLDDYEDEEDEEDLESK